jgi:hypothetical protein
MLGYTASYQQTSAGGEFKLPPNVQCHILVLIMRHFYVAAIASPGGNGRPKAILLAHVFVSSLFFSFNDSLHQAARIILR